MEKIVDKVVQLYMENDYDYIVSLVKAGKNCRINHRQHVEFLKRNSIVPADMLEEDIQKWLI